MVEIQIAGTDTTFFDKGLSIEDLSNFGGGRSEKFLQICRPIEATKCQHKKGVVKNREKIVDVFYGPTLPIGILSKKHS